ncbi:hypothetical protein K504DRAFT_501516 [Pleomassaria siparia CBS 279.74]|uniref:Uncharacterized protein n=1 Tax=Pleomassaria siparia CBS 279.74 TaxID=1314801 RepID=A0A6G1KCI2_9PLEO|nr:hypothetical protein K504DRAFT_501516 [Pleomassaria siparia CBS 279.74]
MGFFDLLSPRPNTMDTPRATYLPGSAPLPADSDPTVPSFTKQKPAHSKVSDSSARPGTSDSETSGITKARKITKAIMKMFHSRKDSGFQSESNTASEAGVQTPLWPKEAEAVTANVTTVLPPDHHTRNGHHHTRAVTTSTNIGPGVAWSDLSEYVGSDGEEQPKAKAKSKPETKLNSRDDFGFNFNRDRKNAFKIKRTGRSLRDSIKGDSLPQIPKLSKASPDTLLQVPKTRNAVPKLTHEEARKRELSRYIYNLAREAVYESPNAFRFCILLCTADSRNALDVYLCHDNSPFTFRRSEMDEHDKDQILRVGIVKVVRSAVYNGRISEIDAGKVVSGLLPRNVSEILPYATFETLVDSLSCNGGGLDAHTAGHIKDRWTSVEQFQDGWEWRRPVEPQSLQRFVEIPKEGNVYEKGSKETTRYTALRRLIESAIYECKDWKGTFYASAASSLERYHAALMSSRKDKELPRKLQRYKRDWTFREQRLLRRGAIVLKLTKQHKAGKVEEVVLNKVRKALIQFDKAHFNDVYDLEQDLIDVASDPECGFNAQDMPDYLVLHPEFDEELASEDDEAVKMEHYMAETVDFIEAEAVRLKDIENAQISLLALRVDANMEAKDKKIEKRCENSKFFRFKYRKWVRGKHCVASNPPPKKT